MTSRWYNILVALFWLATMTWLTVEKIIPPLLRGDPPDYGNLVALDEPAPAPVAWRMFWDDRPIGEAVGQTRRGDDGMSEITSRVRLDNLPLAQLAPFWVTPVLRALDSEDATLSVTAESTFSVDPLGHLVGFHSQLGLEDDLDAITMQGRVEGDELSVTVRAGEFVHTTQSYLPSNALVGDVLSPRERLPGLRRGQTWSEPVYSPFRPPSNPVEVLQASVERETRIDYDGRPTAVWLVVFRTDAGSTATSVLRGRMWVGMDGRVLRQEVRFMKSRLVFVRAAPGNHSETSPASLQDGAAAP
jgi:hypothetical protein